MKARPVASNTNAPTEAISKKLSKIFNAMPPPPGKSVKNGTDFANQVCGEKVNKNEEMGSYDVTSLYPSVPIDFTLRLLMGWLILNGTNQPLALAYVELAQLCMKQNVFQFRGKFFFQFEGACIGSALSSFFAEMFMCHFEMSIEKHPLFPRFYRRYMDDIFVIQNQRMFDRVKAIFEERMDEIKKGAIRFTIERQNGGKIAFLNTQCEVVNGQIEIDVYRKPTHTMRLITSDSFHDMKHKMAAYHAMSHFMHSLPLSEEKIRVETEKIVEIGETNGFSRSAIMDVVNRHRKKKQLRDISTLYNDPPEEPLKRIAIRYFPEITRLLKPLYRKVNLELVHRNDGSLMNMLGSIKDPPLELHKSGVYRISCFHCGRAYYGMTIRKLFVRFNEHVKSANWKNKTAVGKHIFTSKHEINISELELIKPVKQMWKVEFWEAIHIHKHKHENLLNVDDGNVTSPLLNVFRLERRIDKNIIDLTDDTNDEIVDASEIDESLESVFYDCE